MRDLEKTGTAGMSCALAIAGTATAGAAQNAPNQALVNFCNYGQLAVTAVYKLPVSGATSGVVAFNQALRGGTTSRPACVLITIPGYRGRMQVTGFALERDGSRKPFPTVSVAVAPGSPARVAYIDADRCPGPAAACETLGP